jgi:predicted  nucleic acid-binding Zn-ribbon protein
LNSLHERIKSLINEKDSLSQENKMISVQLERAHNEYNKLLKQYDQLLFDYKALQDSINSNNS